MKKNIMAVVLTAFLVSFVSACNAVTPGPSTTRSSAAVISATEAAETQAVDAASEAESTTAEETSTSAAETEESLGEGESIVYVRSGVNVRDQPNTNSNVLGTLTAGQAVKKLGEEGGWTIIEYNGQTCYVYSSYLTEEEP